MHAFVPGSCDNILHIFSKHNPTIPWWHVEAWAIINSKMVWIDLQLSLVSLVLLISPGIRSKVYLFRFLINKIKKGYSLSLTLILVLLRHLRRKPKEKDGQVYNNSFYRFDLSLDPNKSYLKLLNQLTLRHKVKNSSHEISKQDACIRFNEFINENQRHSDKSSSYYLINSQIGIGSYQGTNFRFYKILYNKYK